MAMPRPSGKALAIAEKVIPGLQRGRSQTRRGGAVGKEVLSEVEIKETANIENQKGLKLRDPSKGKI